MRSRLKRIVSGKSVDDIQTKILTIEPFYLFGSAFILAAKFDLGFYI